MDLVPEIKLDWLIHWLIDCSSNSKYVLNIAVIVVGLVLVFLTFCVGQKLIGNAYKTQDKQETAKENCQASKCCGAATGNIGRKSGEQIALIPHQGAHGGVGVREGASRVLADQFSGGVGRRTGGWVDLLVNATRSEIPIPASADPTTIRGLPPRSENTTVWVIFRHRHGVDDQLVIYDRSRAWTKQRTPCYKMPHCCDQNAGSRAYQFSPIKIAFSATSWMMRKSRDNSSETIVDR